jgi:hypothetical protein
MAGGVFYETMQAVKKSADNQGMPLKRMTR